MSRSAVANNKIFTSCRPTHPPAYQISILTSINLGDMVVQKINKVWVAYILHTPKQKNKFLHGAIVPANAYQCTKFQLPSSIGFGDMDKKGVLK